LVGGCLETNLAGTPYGAVRARGEQELRQTLA
jgi:hypothetical protein